MTDEEIDRAGYEIVGYDEDGTALISPKQSEPSKFKQIGIGKVN